MLACRIGPHCQCVTALFADVSSCIDNFSSKRSIKSWSVKDGKWQRKPCNKQILDVIQDAETERGCLVSPPRSVSVCVCVCVFCACQFVHAFVHICTRLLKGICVCMYVCGCVCNGGWRVGLNATFNMEQTGWIVGLRHWDTTNKSQTLCRNLCTYPNETPIRFSHQLNLITLSDSVTSLFTAPCVWLCVQTRTGRSGCECGTWVSLHGVVYFLNSGHWYGAVPLSGTDVALPAMQIAVVLTASNVEREKKKTKRERERERDRHVIVISTKPKLQYKSKSKNKHVGRLLPGASVDKHTPSSFCACQSAWHWKQSHTHRSILHRIHNGRGRAGMACPRPTRRGVCRGKWWNYEKQKQKDARTGWSFPCRGKVNGTHTHTAQGPRKFPSDLPLIWAWRVWNAVHATSPRNPPHSRMGVHKCPQPNRANDGLSKALQKTNTLHSCVFV